MYWGISRRALLAGGAVALAVSALPKISLAGNPTGEKLHGLSSFGDLKYQPGFSHFEYASPEAPKGGRFRFSPSYWFFNQNPQTFNTLNSFVLRGEAPPRMEMCFDTLMTWAIDEPDSLYCSLAKTVEISADRNTYRFTLRPEARFHDGSKVTGKDVAFSYNTMKSTGHPQISQSLRDLDEAVATDDASVELRFNGDQSDRAILSVANLVPIFSADYYATREFDASTFEMPLASGPYRVARHDQGRYVEYERVKDYWARDMGFARGLHHFDMIRIDFFRDRTAAFEAFKKGEVEWRGEFTSKVWATEYNFPAVTDGRVRLDEQPSEKRPALQGWALNSRREKLADAKTREAIGLCFDFEWTNRNLFYGAYTRSQSIFEKSDFKAQGKPGPDELALLEPFRDQLPEAVFGEAVLQPETSGTGQIRRQQRQALRLMREAGWQTDNGRLVNEKGEPLALEILIRSPTFERILGNYVENLKSIGVDASIRLVDPSQFQARIDGYDFDMVGIAVGLSPSPTPESLRQLLSSEAASRNGTYNYPGISSPVIDELVQKLDKVDSREQMVTILKTIDRVLRPTHLWIPNCFAANHRLAFWDIYDWKEPKPDYFFPVERLWWFDEEKAKAIDKA